MRRDGSLPHHRLAGLLLRAATTLIRILPGRLAYLIADGVAPLVVAYTRLHERRVAPLGRGLIRNQRIVFREQLTPERSRRLLKDWARHMTWLVIDFCRIPRIDAHNIERYIDTAGVEVLRPIYNEGQGLICVSGHIGVWELLGHTVTLLGMPATIVVRSSSLRPVDDVVNDIRRSGGQTVLDKEGVLWPLKKALDRGEMVGFLTDENVRADPIFVPFLGTLAASSPAAAFLQRVTGAPIAVVGCHRIGRERYQFRVWTVIRCRKTEDRAADLLSVTAEINRALSGATLEHPEQWFWGSRRFLTRPADEKPDPDGLPPRAPVEEDSRSSPSSEEAPG